MKKLTLVLGMFAILIGFSVAPAFAGNNNPVTTYDYYPYWPAATPTAVTCTPGEGDFIGCIVHMTSGDTMFSLISPDAVPSSAYVRDSNGRMFAIVQ